MLNAIINGEPIVRIIIGIHHDLAREARHAVAIWGARHERQPFELLLAWL